jgi:hypothetical protein
MSKLVATVRVNYLSFDHKLNSVLVSVNEAAGYFPPRFYAHKIETLGCGKNASSVENAARELVSDHGRVLDVEVI